MYLHGRNCFTVGYGSWACFCTEKGHSGLFWLRASLAFNLSFLGYKRWVMHAQLFKSCRMTPFWINSERLQHSPTYGVYQITAFTRSYFIYDSYTYSMWKSHVQFGPTLCGTCACMSQDVCKRHTFLERHRRKVRTDQCCQFSTFWVDTCYWQWCASTVYSMVQYGLVWYGYGMVR